MHRSKIKVASSIVSLVIFAGTIAACSGTSEDGSDESVSYASAEQELTTTKTVGDWRKFPNGECLAAVQGFYPAQFDEYVPVAGEGSDGSCAAHGACKIWLDRRPDPSQWERIEDDGRHMPTTYDLIVYPPIGGDPWGHIASVDHVEGRNIFVMDSNYVAHERKAPDPHTVSWPSYGWYHLKKLGGSPAPTVKCVPGGSYCGGDKVTGDKNWLYRCNSEGDGETLIDKCAKGCRVLSGRDDTCE